MNNRFKDRIESYFSHEDPIVQHFAITALKGTHLATEETLLKALEAAGSVPSSPLSKQILPFIGYMPINEKALFDILSRAEQKETSNNDKFFYLRLLLRADTELLVTYESQLKDYFNHDALKDIKKIAVMDEEELFDTYSETKQYLENNRYEQWVFDFGKRIVDRLIKSEAIDESAVTNWLNQQLQKNFLDYHGFYTLYAAGELKCEKAIPYLIEVLGNAEESDIALEEAVDALVKIGTDDVIDEVEKIALKDDVYYFSIPVLQNIKTLKAEQSLMKLLPEAKDLTAKTMIAEALSKHLSADSIPLVADLVETGYDSGLLELEESLNANCVINNIDHPHMSKWRSHLEKIEIRAQKARMAFESGDMGAMAAHMDNQSPSSSIPGSNEPAVNQNKIGRNDPCPCGSGKKYKKCCMN
jgi:hypothetical protein